MTKIEKEKYMECRGFQKDGEWVNNTTPEKEFTSKNVVEIIALPYYITVDALTHKEIKFLKKCLMYEGKYTDTIIESGLTKVPRLDAIRILKGYVKNTTGRDKVIFKTTIFLLKHCI